MPQVVTRCPSCAASWTGLSTCHCAACHQTLAGVSLFDQHRRRGRCADPAALLDHGQPLRLVAGIWRGPERPIDSLPAA